MRCRIRYRSPTEAADRELVGDLLLERFGLLYLDVGRHMNVRRAWVRTLAHVPDSTPLTPPHDLHRKEHP